MSIGTGKRNMRKGKIKNKSLLSTLHNLIKHFLILSLHTEEKGQGRYLCNVLSASKAKSMCNA